MITGGVSFQPGSLEDPSQRRTGTGNGSQQGVQEAIRVLSLRLPKVMGSQAPVAAPLLTAPGSGGAPHVDSIVQQVLQRYLPNDQSPAPSAPMVGPSMAPSYTPAAPTLPGPSFSGEQQGPRREMPSFSEPAPMRIQMPRVVMAGAYGPSPDTSGPPAAEGNPFPAVDGSNEPSGAMAPAPDLRGYFDWLSKAPVEKGENVFGGMPPI